MNLETAKRLLARTHGFYRCPQCNLEAVPDDDTVSSDEHGASVHKDCPKGGSPLFTWIYEAPNREKYQDALETLISLTMPRPEGGPVMTASEAQALLEKSKLVCRLCGDKVPPIVMAKTNEGAVPCHDGCTRTSHTCQLARIDVSPLLLNYGSIRDALTSVVALYEALRHALPYCYDPCDQTVGCPECGEI